MSRNPVFLRMTDGAMMEMYVVRNDTREQVPIESLTEDREFRCRLRFRPVGKKADQFDRMDFIELIAATAREAVEVEAND
jgi:hypothetical protein